MFKKLLGLVLVLGLGLSLHGQTAHGGIEMTGVLDQRDFITFTDLDTTPSVLNANHFKEANTGATSITALDDGLNGQGVFIACTTINTTFVDGGNLSGMQGNFVCVVGGALSLEFDGTTWIERGRSPVAPGGAPPNWEDLVNTANASTSYTSDNTPETFTASFESNFTTGCQFCIIQQTGNPVGGIAFSIEVNDANVLPFAINDGTNNVIEIDRTGKLSWGAAADVSFERTSDPNTVLGIAQTAGSVFGLPVNAADPNTATWGTGQDGRTWFNSTSNTWKGWDGAGVVTIGPGGGAAHDVLSATHTDTLAAAVVRGDLMVGNVTPAWSRLAVGGANTIFGSNGTDPSWETATGTASPVRANNPLFPVQVRFTAIAAPSYAAGQLFYDSTDQALGFHNDESDVTLQIGQEEWIRARNESGSTITNGQVVYINGTASGLPRIALARANIMATSEAVGLVTHDIENLTNGYVTASGLVRDFDTSSFTIGDRVYLSPSVAGALTATTPSDPNFVVPIGIVTEVNITTGDVLVTLGAPRPRGDTGIAVVGNDLRTASTEEGFLNSGVLSCGASTAGSMRVHTTPLQYCDNAATPLLQYAAYGAVDGDALAGDSATGFFDTGTIEAARLPSAAAATLGVIELDNALGGTASAVELAAGVAGDGIVLNTATAPDSLDIDLNATVDGVGSASNLSGMEFTATGELALLQGCALNDILKYNTTGDLWECATDVSGGSPTLDTITAAVGTASINSGDNAIVWNWQLTTAGKNAFEFTENVAGTATGDAVLVDIATLAASTVHPLEVTSRGDVNGIRVGATDGIVVALGSGGLDWPALLNYPTGCTNQFVRAVGDTLTCNDVTLTTDTAGNYVDDVTGGNGIAVTHTPAEGSEPAVAVDLLTVQDGAGVAFSFSGMEFQGAGTDKLTLLQGCTDNQILKWDDEAGGNGRWDCAIDVSGGTPLWSDLGDPTAATTFTSGAAAETVDFQYQFAFTTGNQYAIRQNTGNPSGGTLFAVTAADTDVIVANFGDGTNGVTINQEGDLTVALGTITADNQAFDSTATWNNVAVTFTHLKANVTDTTSAAGSLLIDLQVGGTSQFKVDKAGVVTAGASTAGGVSQLGGASDTGASAWEIFGGDGASNIEPGYLQLHQSATGEDAFLFPCDTDGAMCLSASTPTADSTNVIMTLATVESPTNKTIEVGLATTTHAANANIVQSLRHATDCTAITDGKDGEICWEQDANTFYVCEPSAGDCSGAEWIALAAAGAAWDTLTDPTGAVTMNSNANVELVQFNYTSALGATDVAFQIEQLTGNPVAGSILLELVAADTDILLLSAGTGANTIDITQAGAMSAQGTASITATDLAADTLDALTEIDGTLCGTNQILEDQGAAWACIATPAGATVRWDQLTDPTAAINLNSNANTELFQMNFTSALGATDVAVQIEQLTGNPVAGSILLELVAADIDILLLSAGAGANTIDITQAGAMSPQGTATITASDVLSSAGASPTASGKIAYDTTSDTLEFGENGPNRLIATRNADNNYSVNQTYAVGVDLSLNNGSSTSSTSIITGVQLIAGGDSTGGGLSFQPGVSTGKVNVRTSAAEVRFQFDPGGSVYFKNRSGNQEWYGIELTSDAAISAGDVVKTSSTTDSRVITSTTSGDDDNFVGVAQDAAGAAGTAIRIAVSGVVTNVVNDGGCTRGDFAKVSATTAGRIECTTTFDQAMIGMVTASAATASATNMLILPRSGSTGTGDVTDVGPGCAGGACWTDGVVTTGTSLLIWEGTGDDANEFTVSVPANPGADILWTVPDAAASLTFFSGTDTVVGRATTDTLTEKSLDVEDSGNVVTTVSKIYIDGASCIGATATLNWDDAGTGDTAPTAACNDAGSIQRPSADFAGGAVNSFERTIRLPSDWASAENVDISIRYVSVAASPTGNVEWDVSTICRAAGQTWDAAFNTAQTITDTVAAQNILNDGDQAAVTMTTCAADEDWSLKISRDGVNDTNNDLAKLLGVMITIRRDQ